jgi:hypothetical protein
MTANQTGCGEIRQSLAQSPHERSGAPSRPDEWRPFAAANAAARAISPAARRPFD